MQYRHKHARFSIYAEKSINQVENHKKSLTEKIVGKNPATSCVCLYSFNWESLHSGVRRQLVARW